MNKPKRPDPWDIEATLDYDLPWKDSTPEEYAARNWLEYQVFSPENWEIENEELKKWVLRLGEILNDTSLLDECRRKHLPKDEYDDQEKKLKDL